MASTRPGCVAFSITLQRTLIRRSRWLNWPEFAGLSVFHFARTFTRAMGVSPHRYVSRMRLENAMAEIAAGKLSLAEIAFNAGFSSQASFTRAFYRLSGLTPGEYRTLR